MKLENIEKLITLFQHLGGKFENAEVRYNEEVGCHCHSLNNKKNTIISCPANLLVDITDIDINKDGLFIANPDKYGENITFLNQYFSFYFNKNVVAQKSKRKRQIESLSKKDLSFITNIFPPSLLNLNKYDGMDYEKKRILDSHNAQHLGKQVIMPFVTLINYHKDGRSYNNSDEKISVAGKFNGEILAKYNNDDVLRIASGYDFITDTKAVYSIPLTYPLINGKKMIINCNTSEAVQLGNGHWRPIVQVKQDSITLSWFPLHLEGSPIYPAIIAKLIADEINIPAENLILNVLKLNLHALIPAAFQLKNSKNAFANYLGEAAQRQLEIIAGDRN